MAEKLTGLKNGVERNSQIEAVKCDKTGQMSRDPRMSAGCIEGGRNKKKENISKPGVSTGKRQQDVNAKKA